MKVKTFLSRSFNWRMLLVRVLVNMLALLITLLVVPNIFLIDRSVLRLILLAAALGVLNAVIKPIIQVLTLRFIFATTGFVVILINGIILQSLNWIFPEWIAINGIVWVLVGGAVLGMASTFFESLFGVSPPIVADKYPEVRMRVKDRQFYRTQAVLARLESRSSKGGQPGKPGKPAAEPAASEAQPVPLPEFADNAANDDTKVASPEALDTAQEG